MNESNRSHHLYHSSRLQINLWWLNQMKPFLSTAQLYKPKIVAVNTFHCSAPDI